MGTSFSGQTPSQTYKDVLQISNSNAGIPTGLRPVSDGNGTDSALRICTTGVDINGILSISGTVLTVIWSPIKRLLPGPVEIFISTEATLISLLLEFSKTAA